MISGPDLFEYNGEIVYGFMLAFIPTVVALYAVGTLATPVYSAILTIRPAFIIPSVLVLAFIGSFAVRGEVFDVGVATACGLLGFVLLRSGFKIAPIILGIVLGPLIEENFIRSLTLVETEGSVFQFFFGRPIFQMRSKDGLHFKAEKTELGPYYMRVFRRNNAWYAIAKNNILLRSEDGLAAFEPGPELHPRSRHVGLHRCGNGRLWVYYSRIGDAPERILR